MEIGVPSLPASDWRVAVMAGSGSCTLYIAGGPPVSHLVVLSRDWGKISPGDDGLRRAVGEPSRSRARVDQATGEAPVARTSSATRSRSLGADVEKRMQPLPME